MLWACTECGFVFADEMFDIEFMTECKAANKMDGIFEDFKKAAICDECAEGMIVSEVCLSSSTNQNFSDQLTRG